MTVQERISRDNRVIRKVRTMLGVHDQLRQYASAVQVSIENTAIVLRGHLPTAALKQALVPAIRQAGVLGRVSNEVRVSG